MARTIGAPGEQCTDSSDVQELWNLVDEYRQVLQRIVNSNVWEHRRIAQDALDHLDGKEKS